MAKQRLFTKLILITLFSTNALAQPESTTSDSIIDKITLEEVYVTGSYIKGLSQEDLASPLTVVDRSNLLDTGAFRVAEIVNNLTINTGSENNPDAFTQNFTSGTSNINLRGLGVASTLVLLNGRRQTYSAFVTDRGENFVDTASLVPMIAIERVEILKDGAASLYGSDAVAGVANFITRDDFTGIELDIETLSGDGFGDTTLSGIFGFDLSSKTHFMGAFSVLDRDSLQTSEKRFSEITDDTSSAGFPGSFLVPTFPVNSSPALQGAWQTFYDTNSNFIADFLEPQLSLPPVPGALQPAIADAACDPAVTGSSTTLQPATFPLGACGFDFGNFFTLVPEEERNQIFASLTHDINENISFYAEAAYANNEAVRLNSPSFPIATTPLICGDGSLDAALGGSCAALGPHPDNPFGVDVLFIGRVFGAGSPPATSLHESETERLVVGLEAKAGEWDLAVDYAQSKNNFVLTATDTLATEFQNALVGLGGADCVGTVGVDIAPGLGPCGYFNPFGTSLTGTGTQNSQAILDYITGTIIIDAEAELKTISGQASTTLFEMPGGLAGFAAGVQIRDESLVFDYDDQSNAENFIFFFGNPDFNIGRDIRAAFAELNLPLNDTLDLQLSVRFEDYDDSGSSTDPKVAALWRANDNLTLRGSFTTSFRAPSIFQQNGIQTSLAEISTPAGTRFLPVRAQTNPSDSLDPEEADIINLGASWSSDDDAFKLSIDYWSYDYDNVVIQQNPQAVLNAVLAGDTSLASQIVGNPLSPSRINVFYDNASTLETDGVDLQSSYSWADTGSGSYRVGAELTQVLSYDIIDPQAGSIDGLGKRNFNNFATSVPELRANLNFQWTHGKHLVNAFMRYIDSYINDQLGSNGVALNQTISSHNTLDLQYAYQFEPLGNGDQGMTLSVGAINITDEEPPSVRTNGGFDTKVHDPRGAVYYLKLNIPL